MRIASFDVDAQKGFTPLCPEELPVQGGETIVPELNWLAAQAQLRLGSKDAHSPQARWVVETPQQMLQPLPWPNADLTWVSHCVPGTTGFELLDGLPHPVDYDFFVWKGIEPDMHPYGACYHDLADQRSTGVIEFLRGAGVTHVLVGGLALDYCVKNTALQLQRAGFQVVVHLPACRSIAHDTETSALAQMRETGVQLSESQHQLLTFINAV